MRYQMTAVTFFCLFALAAAVAAPTASFNTHNSTQAFQKNQDGGLQQVTAKDPNGKDLIAAIRTQLEAEAQRFGDGHYVDSRGKAVPGVQYLKAVKPSEISIIYRNVTAGAAIDYVGKDSGAVDAIHKWLDAEISDQG